MLEAVSGWQRRVGPLESSVGHRRRHRRRSQPASQREGSLLCGETLVLVGCGDTTMANAHGVSSGVSKVVSTGQGGCGTCRTRPGLGVLHALRDGSARVTLSATRRDELPAGSRARHGPAVAGPRADSLGGGLTRPAAGSGARDEAPGRGAAVDGTRHELFLSGLPEKEGAVSVRSPVAPATIRRSTAS